MKIENRVVLVTGASSGIGAATAQAMARHRARTVILVARNETSLAQVAATIRAAGTEALVYPVDLADSALVQDLAKRVEAEVGTPDIIVNNAGAGRWLFAEETPMEEVVAMMAVPYFAAFWVTRAFLPGMLKRRSGHLVNLNSAACYLSWAGATGYSSARWALRGFTSALRADLWGTGVGVTHLVAGKVSTPYFGNNPGSEERIPGISRLYRTLTAEEVAEAVVRCVTREPREVIIPRLLQMSVWMYRFTPWPIDWLLKRTGVRREVAGF